MYLTWLGSLYRPTQSHIKLHLHWILKLGMICYSGLKDIKDAKGKIAAHKSYDLLYYYLFHGINGVQSMFCKLDEIINRLNTVTQKKITMV